MPFHWGGAALDQPPDQPGARSRSAACRSSRCARCGSSAVRRRSEDRMKQMKRDIAVLRRVIGNGMAGARFVEELLARGGGDRFDDHDVRRRAVRQLQPHPALERAERRAATRATSSSIRSSGTARTASRCTPASRRPDRPRGASSCTASDGDSRAVRQPGHRHRQPPFIPPMAGLTMRDGSCKRRVRLPHARRLPTRIAGTRQGARRAAVIGGGLLGLEAARGLLNYGARGARGPPACRT